MIQLARFVLGAAMLASSSGLAAEFVVNSTADAVDSKPGDGVCATAAGVCTLRAAIQEANGHAGKDSITLPAGTYLLSIPGRGEDAAAAGDLDITDDLVLDGAGAESTIVDGAQLDRVFHVDPGLKEISVELHGITIRNGKSVLISFVLSDGGGLLLGAPYTLGGPYPSGSVTLVDCVVRDNSTEGGGGGLGNNAGTMTLIRTQVLSNLSGRGAGGIANTDLGKLTLIDSTVADNTTAQVGGGIFSGEFDIAEKTSVRLFSSTVSGNTGQSGGGVYINRGLFEARNCTISGNTSTGPGSYGGGLFLSGSLSQSTISSCTITGNHSSLPNSGGGGGGITAATNTALQNTLIAGNTTAGGGPDCVGTLTSGGHNLIGDKSGCALTGNTVGTITGKDPLLAPLANNGGPTATHALLAGSPAIDSGDPASPGGPGTACPSTDQRGFLRPRGKGCDIGAVEDLGGFRVLGVEPTSIGNGAPILLLVGGSGFQTGATVKLSRQGEQDIIASAVSVAGDAVATALLDVSGKTPGGWDLVVGNPDGTSARLNGALSLETSRGAKPWATIVGPARVRPGEYASFFVLYGNDGNQDAFAVPMGISVSGSAGMALPTPITPPPAQSGQAPVDWSTAHLEAGPDGGVTSMPVVIATIPAGGSGLLEIAAPVTGGSGQTFSVFGGIGSPLVSPLLEPDATAVDAFVAGAEAYAQSAFGLTVPTSAVPSLRSYVVNQLQAVAASGRGAVIATDGSSPVHSLSQLAEDQGVYAIGLASGSHALQPPPFASPVSRSPGLGGGAGSPGSGSCQLIIPRGAICPVGCSCKSPSPGPQPPIPPECQNPADAMAGKCRPPEPLCEKLSGVRWDPGTGTCTPCTRDPKSCQPPWLVKILVSRDPNDKVGLAGVGASHWVAPDARLSWSVEFENQSTATGPAQIVNISDLLDPSLVDLDTLKLGAVAFGQSAVALQAGIGDYVAVIDLRPDQQLLVRESAVLDRQTGGALLRSRLARPLDPSAPVRNPGVGFLPPNVASRQRGRGR